MVGMMLLGQAKVAGLTVVWQGDKLVVRGPRSAEALVKELLAHKREVLDALVEAAKLPGWLSWIETRADGSSWYVEERDDEPTLPWEDCVPWTCNESAPAR